MSSFWKAVAGNVTVQKAYFDFQSLRTNLGLLKPSPNRPAKLWEGGGVEVHLVPIFRDNYAYVIAHTHSGECTLIDPAEPQKVLDYCTELGVRATLSLTTHKHHDHAGGNAELKELLPAIVIVGGRKEKVPLCSFDVTHTQVFAMHTPCHTLGHTAYLLTPPHCKKTPLLFSGDTLFVAGVGGFFEGNAEQMVANMERLAQLPHDTMVFPGHEYTLANLAFALKIEPENDAIGDKLVWARERRHPPPTEEDPSPPPLPTVPSTIGEELNYNPFMRCHLESVRTAVGGGTPAVVMSKLKQMQSTAFK